MKSSYPSPSPDPLEVARKSTNLAIARWKEAKERSDQMEGPGARLGDPSNKWGALAVTAAIDAERNLILTILAWDDGFRDWDQYEALKECRPARGVISSGVLYAVVPHPDHSPGSPANSADVMRLVTIPLSPIVAID